MKRAVYTGSFDPITNGHMDIIRRASEIFDVLIVSVLNNKEKTPLFSVEERVKILEEATKDLPNVQIDSFSGLLVDYAQERICMSLCGDCVPLRILSTNCRWPRPTGCFPTAKSIPFFNNQSGIRVFKFLCHQADCKL